MKDLEFVKTDSANEKSMDVKNHYTNIFLIMIFLYVKSSDKMFPNKIKLENSRNKKIMLAITYNRYKVNLDGYKNHYKYLIKVLTIYNIRYKYGTNTHLLVNKLKFLFSIYFI